MERFLLPRPSISATAVSSDDSAYTSIWLTGVSGVAICAGYSGGLEEDSAADVSVDACFFMVISY